MVGSVTHIRVQVRGEATVTVVEAAVVANRREEVGAEDTDDNLAPDLLLLLGPRLAPTLAPILA